MKVDATVKRETAYIAVGTFLLGMITQAVFLVIGKWGYTVLLGNILSWALGVLNFFLMGLTVQKALGKDEAEARKLMKASQIYRQMLVMLGAVIGLILPRVFSIWTVIIPLVFPRIVISLRPLLDKRMQGIEPTISEEVGGGESDG